MRILLAEDEFKVASFIRKGLEEQQHTVDVVYDGSYAKKIFLENDYSLVILDVMLPECNGMEICRYIRTFNEEVPILMLTALGTTSDKVRGLEAGADDYVVKPFHFGELLARVHALSRRKNLLPKEKTYVFGDLRLDNNTKTAVRAGRAIHLTAREFALLELFLINKNKVLSRTFIAEAVWGIDFDTGTNVIDVYVNYLRNKIEKGFDQKLIHTVIGMGYILKEA